MGNKPPFFINNPHGQPTSREPQMIEIRGQRPRKPPIQCWGCKGDHMYKYCLHRGDKEGLFRRYKKMKQLMKWA
jgi:hypothetical protein